MESEEEALCRNYPYALYFVQSPSTISHANSSELVRTTNQSPPRPALSRYSSRGSNHSFPPQGHEKNKISYDDVFVDDDDQNGRGGRGGVVENCVDEEGEDLLEDEYYGGRRNGGWKRVLSMGYSNSGAWVFIQITWRLVLSMVVGLVVFYLATKPPSPNVSLKIVGMRQWRLGEGVDGTGVSTKMLSCNCSIHLIIDNKSKLFGLHINPPLSQMYFGKLPFANSQPGGKLYAGSYGTTLFKLSIGTKNKPMYGAGRAMEDMLDSGKGLPVVVRVHFLSWFRVVWGLIRPKFQHQAECLIYLSKSYNNKHQTQLFNSTCVLLH